MNYELSPKQEHYSDIGKQGEKSNSVLLEVLSPILLLFAWLLKGRPAVGDQNGK